MTHTVRENKIWLIAVFALIAAVGIFFSWQKIYAQTPTELPPPSATGASTDTADSGSSGSGGSSASPTPPEPTFSLHQVVSGIKVSSKKSWDGQVFSTLKFKYKTIDGRVLTVVLPAEYKAEKRTKAGWETLFIVYAMDFEIALDAMEKNRPPDVSAFMGKLMEEIRGQTANRPAPDVISDAMEKAKAYLPAMGFGNISMPIMLPGMP